MKSLFHIAQIAIAALVAGCSVARNSASTEPAPAQPKRVTGIGGVFFKSKDPAAVRQWYATHLGFQIDEWGTNFEWRQADDGKKKGFTQWGPFRQDAKKIGPAKDFMMNYRVENLEWLLGQLKKEGVTVLGEIQVEDYGKFATILDLEGNRVELWEPYDEKYEKTAKARTK
jgi:predicted enzyme related to lactoylglutathione lyase